MYMYCEIFILKENFIIRFRRRDEQQIQISLNKQILVI